MPAADKPIPGKAYGSIPHLIGSRMGTGDHHCTPGWVEIATVQARKGDSIFVSEKLDGGCVAVARRHGNIIALNRAGYLAITSPYAHHHMFSAWVEAQKDRFADLEEGDRTVGEWMAQAHGTIYDIIGEPFIPFDIIRGYGNKGMRLPHREAREYFAVFELEGAKVLHEGGALSIEAAVALIGANGHHGARSRPEGAVWRVENNGKFEFLVKWVDPNKLDGFYLPSVHPSETPTWNIDPHTFTA